MEKLTIEIIEDAIKSLPERAKELVFKKSAMLRTTQTVIKQGNEIIYPDDIKAGEITVMEFPEVFDSPKFESNFYFDEPFSKP